MAEETTSNPVVAATDSGVTDNGPDAQSQQTQTVTDAAPEAGKQSAWRDKFQNDPDKMWDAYRNAQGQLTRLQQEAKRSGKDVKEALLGDGQQAQQATQQQGNQQQTEQYIRQQGGSDAEVRAYQQLIGSVGPEAAQLEVIRYYTKEAARAEMQAHLAPIQQEAYDAKLVRAYGALQAQSGVDPEDFWAKEIPKLKEALNSRPKLKTELKKADSAQEMYELLEFAYSKVQKDAKEDVGKAAQAAGAKREQQRSQMAAAASVETGRGSDLGKSGKTDPADDWLAAMQTMDKGKRLFDK